MIEVMVTASGPEVSPAGGFQHPDDGPAVHRVDDVDAAATGQGSSVKGSAR
jgi:hypothetical protein